MADDITTQDANGNDFDLDPEIPFDFVVPLYGFRNTPRMRFVVKTAGDRFVISHQSNDFNEIEIITITFKQVQSGNLYTKYSAVWYKIRGALFALFDLDYPFVRVVEQRIECVELFVNKFRTLAFEVISTRNKINDALGPLPFIFSTFIELTMPRTNDGLYIIDGNALRMYNARAKRNRWATIRNLDELAYYISQTSPSQGCSVARRQYHDINGSKRRGMVIACDLFGIARDIEQALDNFF